MAEFRKGSNYTSYLRFIKLPLACWLSSIVVGGFCALRAACLFLFQGKLVAICGRLLTAEAARCREMYLTSFETWWSGRPHSNSLTKGSQIVRCGFYQGRGLISVMLTFMLHFPCGVLNWYDIYMCLTAIGLAPGGSSTSHIWLTPGGSSTSHIYTKTINIIQRKENWEVRAVPCLCELYPGICLTTEEKARKNLG
jgi:hypothetical protein